MNLDDFLNEMSKQMEPPPTDCDDEAPMSEDEARRAHRWLMFIYVDGAITDTIAHAHLFPTYESARKLEPFYLIPSLAEFSMADLQEGMRAVILGKSDTMDVPNLVIVPLAAREYVDEHMHILMVDAEEQHRSLILTVTGQSGLRD